MSRPSPRPWRFCDECRKIILRREWVPSMKPRGGPVCRDCQDKQKAVIRAERSAKGLTPPPW